MLTIGAAIDYSRIVTARAQLQMATDSAALGLGQMRSSTQGQRTITAQNRVTSAMNLTKTVTNLNVTETEPSSGTYVVTSTASVQTTFMALAMVKTVDIKAVAGVNSNVVGQGQKLELALALDNTGSMKNDMPALRAAARNLADSVLSAATAGNVKVSVVPYVAAVNPGLTNMSMVDTKVTSATQGRWFMGWWIAKQSNCNAVWGASGGGSGPGSSQSGDKSGDASDMLDLLNPFRKMARELFGVNSAHADDPQVTLNTTSPLVMLPASQAHSPVTRVQYQIPTGFVPIWKADYTAQCEWLGAPTSQIGHLDLFKRMRGPNGEPVAWKGCVEARLGKQELTWLQTNWNWIPYGSSVADYDVTDRPPVQSDPSSLFVPYFWPDEPDYNVTNWSTVPPGPYQASLGGFHNNYMADYVFPTSWGWTADGWGSGHNILKYNNVSKAAIIQETGPTTYGPNASCPDPVLRLTSDQNAVDTKINNLTHWYNGGTVISEGLMWAWRTLSPNMPYADGVAYNTQGVKKVIVLMTDGVNGLADNGSAASANISDYSSYGYMGDNRLGNLNGVTSYDKMTDFLDNRLLAACTNAKAAGISIYTVLFSANLTASGAAHSQNILKQCASSPENAVSAANASTLNDAFANIATMVTATKVRLWK